MTPASAGHQPGDAPQPGIQIDVVRLELCTRQIRFGWRRATGLRVVVGHGAR